MVAYNNRKTKQVSELPPAGADIPEWFLRGMTPEDMDEMSDHKGDDTKGTSKPMEETLRNPKTPF